MAIIIIGLIIAIIYFWSSSNIAKDNLKKERIRIETFNILIESLKNFDGYYHVSYLGYNNAFLTKMIDSDIVKSIGIRPTLNTLYITISLKDRQKNRYNKSLSYPVTINQKEVAETIKAEFLYFESNLLKENPEFYEKK